MIEVGKYRGVDADGVAESKADHKAPRRPSGI
jgi:hypothetical protein